jgi:hypothetical protein
LGHAKVHEDDPAEHGGACNASLIRYEMPGARVWPSSSSSSMATEHLG